MDFVEVLNIFKKEFSALSDKFHIVDLKGNDIRGSKDERIIKSGVYIFWKNGTVIKVGGSLSNTRKRALEHFRDDTGNKMKELDGDQDLHLFVFTVRNKDDEHWAIALEDFLERKLEPEIHSRRRR